MECMSHELLIILYVLFAIFALFIWLLPFIVNANLAKSRGKNVMLMMLLTLIFSWIVTLILAFIPKVEPRRKLKRYNKNISVDL